MNQEELKREIKKAFNPNVTMPKDRHGNVVPDQDYYATVQDKIAENLAKAIVKYVNSKTHTHSDWLVDII